MPLPLPHGGALVQRILKGDERESAIARSAGLPSLTINEELVKDVKNICRGVFSPVEGFFSRQELESTLSTMHLPSGIVWPIPLLLAASKEQADAFCEGEDVALKDETGKLIAILHLKERYLFSNERIAQSVFGTTDPKHPGVAETLDQGDIFLAGPLSLIDDSKEPFYDFNLDPVETRVLFTEKGFGSVTGFQTRNPSHRGHEYLQRCALEITDGLFINPVVGKKKVGDFRDEVILSAYRALVENFFPKSRVVLSILPLRMRYAGPKEAVLHALIRKNFGCTHFVVGRDHAGVGAYYGPFDAQKLFDTLPDLGIEILKFDNSFYCQKCLAIATSKTCRHDEEDRLAPSGTAIRQMLQNGATVSPHLMRDEIVAAIRAFDQPFIE